mmetsp:Transcript_22308/g.62641  ORF Transcript_22308/g.62641 Transcript_22308/m.62641 type:complete len:741 (-) Transcript_22308:102-2324(-)|eukprot:CAMPEP_0119141698 /NCGR_PEP_ID=MMETSP1310-20130426/31443_1 /TAXON_ID=464262 /ORGANISM="Genus nov. species nov., Strain RCC2339" /LENGTH=740 /DNA_ID=CAMNT_0007133169 /DNA_START=181 /DNA_END=2406 /DNA_ORIENTATION=+
MLGLLARRVGGVRAGVGYAWVRRASMLSGAVNKVVLAEDAVELVRDNDSVSCSGFVAQAAPETILEALGRRFEETGSPHDLTLLFGGGPGDYGGKGLNHLAKTRKSTHMLRRSVGGHYGQVPQIAQQVLADEIEGYALPMGSISRMIRATASKCPGHISPIGLGTFVDPNKTGGKLNKRTVKDLVTRTRLGGDFEYLFYRAIPIRVAIIKASTGDTHGNLSFERESLYGDAKNLAMAARASGGIVLAEVERIAEGGSLPPRSVHIPGALVDCVVQSRSPSMSFFTPYDASWSQELRVPVDVTSRMEHNPRRLIARRAFFECRPGDVVNLGIGMPEGVAKVAAEEGTYSHLTLTTEAGLIGGTPAGGHEFGPSTNSSAINTMSEQFDMYNGGVLNVAFLGMAQVSQSGDINVSRLSRDSLTGPGGFIDITQATKNVVFMGTFTKKGLRTRVEGGPEGYRLAIEREGQIRAFTNDFLEVTFSHEQALAQGQRVLYVTERCVFELNHRGIKLVEVAPGIDVGRDIVANMDFAPYVKESDIKEMDQRIFNPTRNMKMYEEWFDMESLIHNRNEFVNGTLFVDLSGLQINDEETLEAALRLFEEQLRATCAKTEDGRVDVIVSYDKFQLRDDLTNRWGSVVSKFEEKYYRSVRRYSGKMLLRKRDLQKRLKFVDDEKVFKAWKRGKSKLSRGAFVHAAWKELHVHLPPEVLDYIFGPGNLVLRDLNEFSRALAALNEYLHHGLAN